VNGTPDHDPDLLADVPDPQPVDAATAALLDVVDGDPLHAHDRALVTAAMAADAAAHGGEIHPSRVRRALADDRGNLVVYPRVVAAAYAALVARGVIEMTRWDISDDVAGRNAGRPCRVYRLVVAPEVAA
jgi:hypothetical protein